ncbi:MAG TPA: LysR family transcriptional regulator [Nitriliruptoraceae bacterium]|nr:LysR family transcriptional regulator [Nitriliruptoraceae bacterium]
MIDPHRLQFLVEVAHWGTVTAAAEAMGYSPSAASQQLAALARDLDIELLDRRGRNVVLTAAGRALVDRADDVFDALEAAETAARRAAEVASGTVLVGALGSTIVDLVPLAIARLHADAPHLTLDVRHLGDDMLDALRHRTVDVAIEHRWSNVDPIDVDGLHVVSLCREPVYVVAPSDLDLNDPRVRADAAWIEHPCAQCGPGTLDVIRRLGVSGPQMQFTTDDMTVMLHVAALGAALPVVPGLVTLHLPDGVRPWAVPDVSRRIGGFIRDVGRGDPGLETVLSHLADAGADVQARMDEFRAGAPTLDVVA